MATETLKSKTAKGVFWSSASNLLSQVVNMLFGLVLARILAPEDYGIVGLLTVFTGLATALQECGLSSALINKKDASQKDYDTVFWFTAGSSVVLYVILFFCTPLIADFYRIPELKPLGRIVFLGFVFSSLCIVPMVKLQKDLHIKKFSLLILLVTILSGLCGVVMALCGLAYWGLALQSVGIFFFRMVFVWAAVRWKPTFSFDLHSFISMWRYGVKILINRIVDTISNNVLIIFLGRYYSHAQVGYYNQASKWSYMAYSVFCGVVTGMMQPVFVQASDTEERLQRVFRKTFRFMAMISFACMFGLALIASEFITVAITDKWAPAVPLMRILCVGGAFIPLTWMCNTLLLSRGKSNLVMWVAIAASCLQLLMVFLCHPFGIQRMTMAYVGVLLLTFLFIQYMVGRELKVNYFVLLTDSLFFCTIAAISMLVTGWIAGHIENIYGRLAGKILLAVMVYVFLLRMTGARIYLEMKDYLLQMIRAKFHRKDRGKEC